MAADLPDWEQIKTDRPDLAARLRADRTDHDSLVGYLVLALGATVIAEKHHDRASRPGQRPPR